MKILGIGNAIVDVICKVNDEFIKKNNLTKSTMKLIFDEKEFKQLLSNLKIEKTVSGGSVANSIVGLSQLGNDVGFIGKVSDDDLGGKYEDGLKTENVKYFYSKKKEELPTGTCLILVTPDSERTMCTFLGTAGKINENDVDASAIKKSEIIGHFGDESENGGWEPHLHFQLSLVKPETHDLPGVVTKEERKSALKKYPDPRLVLGPIY